MNIESDEYKGRKGGVKGDEPYMDDHHTDNDRTDEVEMV